MEPGRGRAAHARRRATTSRRRRRRSRRSPRTGSRSRAPAGCRATVGVDPVFDALAPLLDGERLPSLLLVGPRGAGKTRARAPPRARPARARPRQDGARRRLWATSADRIVAGMVYLGMWQQRCLAIVDELAGGDDVLYVDRLADLMAPMSDGASIAELLAPAVIARRARADRRVRRGRARARAPAASRRWSTRCASCACPRRRRRR